jgi:uncharacterized protein YukE
MAQIGADIQQLATMGRQFTTQAVQVDTLISAINGQLGNTSWVGPSADKFKDQWNSQFVPALRNLEEALRAAGADVENRRQRIEAAGS